MYCVTNKFPELQFIVLHNKPHGVCGLGKHYHMRFDTKLGHVMCAIRKIPCACPPCKFVLDQHWTSVMTLHQ